MEIREIKPTSIKALEIKRVAAYARVSRDSEAMFDSLSSQVSYYNEYICSHPGWIYAGVYADYGISGTKENRPEFQRMLEDARAGKIDIIITKSITRFARNAVTLLKTVREMKELGIEIIFEKENMCSFDANVDMIMTMLALNAEEEARSASENKLWRIRKQFEKGIPTWHNMFGYRMIDGQFHVVGEEAEVVRRIFDDYLSGMGKQQIARRLNDDHILNGNKVWKESSINVILNNEKYTGNMVLQKKYVVDFRTKKQKVNHGERRQYLVEESHEPIISMETFERAKMEQLRRNKRGYGLIRSDGHLFTGLMVCGICKTAFVYKLAPTTTGGIRSKLPVWMCHGYEKLGRGYCPAQRIREDVLMEKTRQVLRLAEGTELTNELLRQKISRIEVLADYTIRYYLMGGQIEMVKWQNPSRSLSWTPEMRKKVSEQNRVRRELASMKEGN